MANRSEIARRPGNAGARRSSLISLAANTDPIGIAGIALSIVMSVALDLTGLASGAESVLAGLMGITISLVLDSTARAERRFQLRKLLDGAPWLSSALVPTLECAAEISRRFPDTAISQEAQRHFDRLHNELEELRRGRIIRPGGDYEHLIVATRSCHLRLDSITNISPRPASERSWWASEIGKRYWQENLVALRRGVKVTRIFIYGEMTTELQQLIDLQAQAGVSVGVIERTAVEAALHANLVVWDRKSAWEARMNAHGEIIGNVYTLNDHDLGRFEHAFNICRMSATFPD